MFYLVMVIDCSTIIAIANVDFLPSLYFVDGSSQQEPARTQQCNRRLKTPSQSGSKTNWLLIAE